MRSKFLRGMYHGVPIALGYLSVSFAFGIMGVRNGLTVLEVAVISLTNLTSAGQAAGVAIIAAGGTLTEMIFTQLVINLRYSLMALSLTQKLDESFNTSNRLAVSFGITDEIYAVAVSGPEKLSSLYMKGLILTPMIGWVGGTVLGAVAGQALPDALVSALGVMLYGMFIAIIVPPCKKDVRLIAAISAAAAVSMLIYYCIPFISSGFSVIISSVIASVFAAAVFPVKESDE